MSYKIYEPGIVVRAHKDCTFSFWGYGDNLADWPIKTKSGLKKKFEVAARYITERTAGAPDA